MANITSYYLPSLKRFNRKAGKHRNIRAGIVVETARGVGIVTVRDKDVVWVAHEPPEGLLWIEQYTYPVDNLTPIDAKIDETSKFYRGAWQKIEDEAMNANQMYEVRKHEAIFSEYESLIRGKKTERTIDMGTWGSTTYRRYTGVNKHGQPFDFEVNIRNPFIPAGDRVLFALGFGDGCITDMNGYGWIYRRKITEADVNYGEAKYAGPSKGDTE